MNLARCIHQFFEQYLPRIKGCSVQTIKAYRDTFKLFVPFAATYHGVKIKSLTVDHLTSALILDFLDHLESNRGNRASTRNQRLAAIKSLAKMIRFMITEKKRLGFQLKKIKLETPLQSLKCPDLIAKSSNIYFKDNVISEILIVMSREQVKKQVLFQIYSTIALLILIIAAIWLTSIFITRRYISTPLLKLQESASLIAQGDLDTYVDKSSSDEIGALAQHLDAMRGSIRQLFAELQKSKDKLQDYSRTLEHKVELRTRELAQSVEELKALGEVSQAVNSTLDLETVLTSIVRHAVQLSKTDLGRISSAKN